MPSKFSLRLGRRGALSAKRGNANYYKGTGARTEGNHTTKGACTHAHAGAAHATRATGPRSPVSAVCCLRSCRRRQRPSGLITRLHSPPREPPCRLSRSPCAGAYVIRPERTMTIVAPDLTGCEVRVPARAPPKHAAPRHTGRARAGWRILLPVPQAPRPRARGAPQHGCHSSRASSPHPSVCSCGRTSRARLCRRGSACPTGASWQAGAGAAGS